jgi:glucosyl-3-phosphoglycerate phosphatase
VRRLVLVRHGESRWNAEARVQGQRCAGLSPIGHAQARVTATALASAYPEAVLVTSDLQRTAETVAPLEDELRRTARHDPVLRERSFGDWEGQLRTEIAQGDPARWDRWLAGEDLIAEVGGESADQLADRVVPGLAELLAATVPGGVTIAVSHGGTIHHGVHRWLGLAAGTLGGVANTSVTEVVAWDGMVEGLVGNLDGGGRVVLDRWNEVAHLPVELRTAWRPKMAPEAMPPEDAPTMGR